MIGERQPSYQLSRWTFAALLVAAIPLVCMPVRGQEKAPAAPAAASATDAGGPKSGDVVDAPAIDPKIRELGEAVHKRLTTWSDVETLTLKDGETGRMKVKKNISPVAEILITPDFVENGTKFELEGVDATDNAIEGTRIRSAAIHNDQTERTGLGRTFLVNGAQIVAKIQLHPTRQDGDIVAVEVKALFARMVTPEELNAMLTTQGKSGQLQLNLGEIGRWVTEYKQRTGRFPNDLAQLNKPLPKDVYSSKGEDYHYEAQRTRFILSSCGKDGIYGNNDDDIMIYYNGGASSGERHEMYPLEEET